MLKYQSCTKIFSCTILFQGGGGEIFFIQKVFYFCENPNELPYIFLWSIHLDGWMMGFLQKKGRPEGFLVLERKLNENRHY
jgi:hypothetical protein